MTDSNKYSETLEELLNDLNQTNNNYDLVIVDSNLEFYSRTFDDAGSAFILKPESLLYKKIVLPDPPKQNKELSYSPRPFSNSASIMLTDSSFSSI